MELKKGMLLQWPNEDRYWIVLEVSPEDIKRGLSTDHIGLHAFAGMWYGKNPYRIKSFGKIRLLSEYTGWKVIKNDTHMMSLEEIRSHLL